MSSTVSSFLMLDFLFLPLSSIYFCILILSFSLLLNLYPFFFYFCLIFFHFWISCLSLYSSNVVLSIYFPLLQIHHFLSYLFDNPDYFLILSFYRFNFLSFWKRSFFTFPICFIYRFFFLCIVFLT